MASKSYVQKITFRLKLEHSLIHLFIHLQEVFYSALGGGKSGEHRARNILDGTMHTHPYRGNLDSPIHSPTF